MPRVITYSLCADQKTSDCYYQAIADLADQWMPHALRNVAGTLSGYNTYRRDMGLTERTDAEYAFELLALGVLLREHGNEALRLPRPLAWTLRRLSDLPVRWPRVEPLAKKVRGWLGWLGRHAHWRARHSEYDLERLLVWLRANGQASRADRLEEWRMSLEPLRAASAQAVIAQALALADDFDRASRRALGRFTQGVELFRAHAASDHLQRYDAELLLRTPLEYHLGMLGTEVLNRAYRERFQATRRRAVIVPPCMRMRLDACKATDTPYGAQCQACTPGCRVNMLTRIGHKRGFAVYMIPDHVSRFSVPAADPQVQIGVVGVSCALTNWSGGWDAEAAGVPAQGVLLDYVGCSYHWDEQGVVTDANLGQIVALATGVDEQIPMPEHPQPLAA
jgi:hypothetical protein